MIPTDGWPHDPTMYVFSTRPPAYREEIVEDSAIAMIDFSELHPDLSEFIDQLRANQVVGRNTSEFPKLWQHTITDVEDENPDDQIWYSFILPMTAEQEIENDQARKQTAGVLCWPMLGVRIDTKKSVIVMAGLYTQCL